MTQGKLTRHPQCSQDNVLYVDPGFHTGLFMWLNVKTGSYLCDTLTYPRDKKSCIIDTMTPFWKGFTEALLDYSPIVVVIEDVFLRPGDPKSMGSALRGDLLTLDKLAAGYMAAAVHQDIPVRTLRAHQWKGQMDDTAVKARVRYVCGLNIDSSHIADACGMSLHEMGIFA